jgi:arylsulfatase B
VAFTSASTDLFTNESIRLINAQPKDTPLFLMINHIAPHSANPHNPLQAPIESELKFEQTIKDIRRRKYAGYILFYEIHYVSLIQTQPLK